MFPPFQPDFVQLNEVHGLNRNRWCLPTPYFFALLSVPELTMNQLLPMLVVVLQKNNDRHVSVEDEDDYLLCSHDGTV